MKNEKFSLHTLSIFMQTFENWIWSTSKTNPLRLSNFRTTSISEMNLYLQYHNCYEKCKSLGGELVKKGDDFLEAARSMSCVLTTTGLKCLPCNKIINYQNNSWPDNRKYFQVEDLANHLETEKNSIYFSQQFSRQNLLLSIFVEILTLSAFNKQ